MKLSGFVHVSIFDIDNLADNSLELPIILLVGHWEDPTDRGLPMRKCPFFITDTFVTDGGVYPLTPWDPETPKFYSLTPLDPSRPTP